MTVKSTRNYNAFLASMVALLLALVSIREGWGVIIVVVSAIIFLWVIDRIRLALRIDDY